MKLYISADIEGIAGVISREQGGPEGFEYAQGREWMTGEVSAACESAYQEGVIDIVVSDSHGNGQNLLVDSLPEDVRLVRSWPRPLGMMQGLEEGGFDAAMLIGYHAGSTNIDGIMAHTLYGSVIREIRINGQIASETFIAAAVAGHFDVPIILMSGDDVYIRESEELLLDFEAVVTKTSFGTLSGSTLTPTRSRAMIQQKVASALKRIGDFAPFKVDGPLNLHIEFKHRLPAELLDYLTVVERMSAYGIEYQAADMVDVTRFLEFVTHYQPTLM